MSAPGGPWITSATVCRHVDDVVPPHVVRELVLDPARAIELALVVELVRGAWIGAIPLRVLGVSPGNEPIAAIDLDLDLPGDREDTAGRIVVPLALAQVQAGVYWFEIVLGETHVTRIPLRLAPPT